MSKYFRLDFFISIKSSNFVCLNYYTVCKTDSSNLQIRIVKDAHFCGFAYLAGIVVELMETRVVGRAINQPRGKDKQVSGSTGIETALWWFPVFAYGFLLQENQGQTSVKSIVDHEAHLLKYLE